MKTKIVSSLMLIIFIILSSKFLSGQNTNNKDKICLSIAPSCYEVRAYFFVPKNWGIPNFYAPCVKIKDSVFILVGKSDEIVNALKMYGDTIITEIKVKMSDSIYTEMYIKLSFDAKAQKLGFKRNFLKFFQNAENASVLIPKDFFYFQNGIVIPNDTLKLSLWIGKRD